MFLEGFTFKLLVVRMGGVLEKPLLALEDAQFTSF